MKRQDRKRECYFRDLYGIELLSHVRYSDKLKKKIHKITFSEIDSKQHLMKLKDRPFYKDIKMLLSYKMIMREINKNDLKLDFSVQAFLLLDLIIACNYKRIKLILIELLNYYGECCENELIDSEKVFKLYPAGFYSDFSYNMVVGRIIDQIKPSITYDVIMYE